MDGSENRQNLTMTFVITFKNMLSQTGKHVSCRVVSPIRKGTGERFLLGAFFLVYIHVYLLRIQGFGILANFLIHIGDVGSQPAKHKLICIDDNQDITAGFGIILF